MTFNNISLFYNNFLNQIINYKFVLIRKLFKFYNKISKNVNGIRR